MASISSVITGGFGAPGDVYLVITDGYATTGEVVEPPVVVTPEIVAGPFLRDPRRQRRNKVIRYSDFVSREAYAEALRAAIPMSEVKPIETMERTIADDDEDEAIIMLLMRVLH